MSVKINSPSSTGTFSGNIIETFALINEAVKAQRLEATRNQKSNISFKLPGYVIGSEEKVEEEEIFLCNRMMNDIAAKRKKVIHPPLQWFSLNNAVTSVLQGLKRPVCGLVALCMAGHMLKKKLPSTKLYSDYEILEIAKLEGYTKQGEMFSAKEYAKLAEKIYDCESTIINDTLLNSFAMVMKHLAHGLPVLVPYDTDRNYEPCLQKGHKAHWAILTGFVIGTEKNIFDGVPRSEDTPVKRILDMSRVDTSVFQDVAINQSMIYIYAKQGKSARQQLWSLRALSASNANLKEASPERDWAAFQVPKDGISNTLCSQSVLLRPRTQ